MKFAHHQVAVKPPMGWNSFNCYGSSVTEEQFKANVDYMAEHLKPFGWEYAVVDFCWSHPDPGAVANPHQDGGSPRLEMDEWGRLIPSPRRFPSSANGAGFKPLADYVHSKGLKFGIHIMRGIPRQAAELKAPVKGTSVKAGDVANMKGAKCSWLNHMYGVDVSKEGGQAYYDSLFELYASWDVDFIKADDILTDYPGPYHKGEIEALRGGIDRCGRPMVLSLSPGPAPVSEAEHLTAHANMWRISMDFWDKWWKLKDQFHLCNAWSSFTKPGAWPDADMLPLGRLALCGPEGLDRQSYFTPHEQRTLMTLWSIFRSPLMYGGEMTSMDEFTLGLLTNPEILEVNQNSENGRQLGKYNTRVIWLADVPGCADRYLALFNLHEDEDVVSVAMEETGFAGGARIRDLWSRRDLGVHQETVFSVRLPPHGCMMYRLSSAVQVCDKEKSC